VDLRDRRELNNGFGNALAVAVELVVTPMIFGFLGFLLDGRLGTKPIFTLVFFLFVLAYVVWKQYVLYGRQMDKEQARIMGPRREGAK
jgi:F0F1-type ATP synthase assembly protein I